ncbi:MAG: DUF3426 domain-containing protein [Gammaproteobacteria bacterium]|nr:DUF3426 domain-containing protein [Gammaproteobacteria bacterium]
MYADCPTCRRQFVVRAQHLSAAEGEVRCGFCGTQFNALNRLHDSPLPDLTPQPLEEAEAEPQFDVPESPPEPPPEPPPVRNIEAVRRERVSRFEPPPEWVRDADEEKDEPRRLAWMLTAVVLLLAAALQAAWFNRDQVLSQFPQLAPFADSLCARLQCSVVRNRDLGAIKLINRDVRLHPRFENFLLLNATIVNESRRRQPFPRVQFALYDTTGATLAYRAFKPEEYLDRSVDRRAGMSPGAPVHFVLEVTGPTEGAVSFEFGFL